MTKTKTKTKTNNLSGSFRDPSGFLFTRGGELFRQVNKIYAPDYDRLMTSGLYDKLVETGRLIQHTEVILDATAPEAHKILRPERVPFISYPYEWSFGQLQDAALATLSIQKRALKFGMSLKDASAFNIQFHRGKAVLIDTLSFEIYQEGEPWVAYRQFCQHFLAPLALMVYRDIRLNQLLRVYIDGIPLDLASQLLPSRTRWNFGLASHIHLHASAQKRYSDVSLTEARRGRTMSKEAMVALIENLRNFIRKLKWKPEGTEWGDYYDKTNYSDKAFEHKKQLVNEWTDRIKPTLCWDLGANTGIFSRQVADTGTFVVAWDIDPAAVEQNWSQVRAEKQTNLLPLVLDLTNPSPSIGWNNSERNSLGQRGPVDMILALAIVHHLAISNNLPFELIAQTLAGWCKWLVIEFIPKTDSQVKKLLRSRKDIFTMYEREAFEAAFRKYFEIIENHQVHESERWIYCMKSV
jgi:hypothetical protein